MAKDQKLLVVWMFLFGFMTFLSFALHVLSSSCMNTEASCAATVDYGLNYTLPTPQRCKVIRHPDGIIQTIPKLFSFPSVVGQIPGLAGRHIICRLPDCVKNLCKNGWCEETKVGYQCHCSTGFQGEHCDAPCSSPLEVLNGGSFYYFSTSEMDHASALSCCSEHDSHLVYIETEEEQDFPEDQIDDLGSGVDYWIGLTGKSRADARWLDGSRLTYDKLKQTSFRDGGECFRIKPSDYYKWHDHPCLWQNGYICEKENDD